VTLIRCSCCLQDAFEKGYIFIGNRDNGFSVTEGLASVNSKDPGFGFTLRTPDRYYHLSADSQQERHEWMLVLEYVINLPLSPQDSKSLYRSSSI